MISQELLNILACPACKGKVSPIESPTALLCRTCGLKFPIREGIPIMLLDEAVADRAEVDGTP